MKIAIRVVSGLIIIVSVLVFPYLGIGIIYGLAGSTAKYYVLIALGYFGLFLFSIVCIFKYKFYPVLLISLLLFVSGATLDTIFWKDHNQQLCEELRAEPSCVENECGFDCEDFQGGGFHTGASICKDKDLEPCREKLDDLRKETEEYDEKEKIVQQVLQVYADIVDKIIASPSPEDEDFEDQLVAIYNCLVAQHGPGYNNVERRAVQVLVDKHLTDEQLNKYYAYLERGGNTVNRKKVVAGLPAGPKSLSCEDIE
jgi:hypothetical protein